MATAIASSSLCSLTTLAPFPLASPPLMKSSLTSNRKNSTRTTTSTCAAYNSSRRPSDNESSSWSGNGRMVDNNMIVLRMRIHEMMKQEEKEDLPREWMDWEKRFYNDSNYDSIICDAIAHLQTSLMETRPSLALGTMALIALSVPTSIAVLLYTLLGFVKALVLSGRI